jgi:hypothetical protein
VTDIERLTEREAWIVLASVDGIGETLLPRLVSEFRGARHVLAAALSGGIEAFNQSW